MNDAFFEQAKRNQLNDVKDLLQKSNLPYNDIDEHFDNFVISLYKNKIIGVMGIEPYNKVGLVRSLAVNNDFRNKGIASKLLEKIIDYSKSKSVEEIFLLTTTASGFFFKFGFKIIDSDKMPDEIKNTSEFQDICPASSICMKKDILNSLTN